MSPPKYEFPELPEGEGEEVILRSTRGDGQVPGEEYPVKRAAEARGVNR